MKEIEKDITRPIFLTGKRYYFIVGILLLIIGFAGFAYFIQIRYGLGVTGMNKPIFWGIYITNFVFFIGISHAGTLISAILRITGAEWRRPITRMAEAITVFALFLGGANIIIDMGRPDKLLNLLKYGRIQSPILWDVIAISIYLTASITYLYLPLIPDIALLRDRLKNVSSWRRKLYKILSIGWRGTEKQKKRLDKAIGIMAILIIPIAVSVHTVVSWIFGMTLQPMWHSTIFGPYFVIGAIFTGIASILIVMALMRKLFHFEKYITEKHFNNLGLLLLVFVLLWFYFTLSEYLTTFYGNEPAHMSVFESKFFGEFSKVFWAMILFCFVIPFLILVRKKTRTIAGTVVAAISVNLGMWLERFTIVVPTLTRPRLPYEFGIYHPTWVEWSITLGCFAIFVLSYAIFSKLFPVISVWEVEEAKNLEG
ncbi:MAG: NrfD/PsrC family molybdoenzyme membrane anchor subunit [Candidatus Methanofastidiosia archaeon]